MEGPQHATLRGFLPCIDVPLFTFIKLKRKRHTEPVTTANEIFIL